MALPRLLAPRRRLAIAADAAAIVVFAVVGLVSHHASPGAFAHDALPLLGGWFAAAAATRLYARPTVLRFLVTWAVGITAGVLMRALILGRDLDGHEAAFLAVSLVFTLLFVVATRAATTALTRVPDTPGRPSV
jgi:Protein of unknown function (DUF3054)